MLHFLHNTKLVIAALLTVLAIYQSIEVFKKKGILKGLASNIGPLLMIIGIADSYFSDSDIVEKAQSVTQVAYQPAELPATNVWNSPWVTVIAIAITAIL